MTGAGAMLGPGRRVDWCTPPEVLEKVRSCVGWIGLDPCSNRRSIVGATVEWREGGLDRPWGGLGPVYMNPPYGRPIGRWTERAASESVWGTEVIGLLPVRTDCGWWHRDVARCRLICFWARRIKFLGARSGAPFPSAVCLWGSPRMARRFAASFADAGMLVSPGGEGIIL